VVYKAVVVTYKIIYPMLQERWALQNCWLLTKAFLYL